MDPEKQVAVVTGAAQGIGRRTAEALAERGYRLALNDLRMPDETIRSIQSRGGQAIGHIGNIADESAVEALVRVVYDAWGRAEVLVNNAGISLISPAEQTSLADYRRILEVNLVAPFLLAKAFGTKMLAARRGCIVNVASISGKEGNPNMIPYSVSKAGVICLTKALAKEVCMEGIRVNCVAPAVIETPILQQLTPEQVAYMCSKIPMGRTGTTEEVAAVVHFLASDDASFINGTTLIVDGGRLDIL